MLDKLSKRLQGMTKSMRHEICLGNTQVRTNKEFECFFTTYEAKFTKAVVLLDVLRLKCELKSMEFLVIAQLVSQLPLLEGGWVRTLAHQLPALLLFREF